ncbi:sulfhydryl oxidase 1 isoform X2 [Ixodes scapularis]
MDESGRLFAGSRLRTRVLTGLITFCVLLFHSTPVRAGLYDGNLPLVNLNASNFYDVLLGKENAWIIQFYSSWCGHCIHFAPMFKAFAHDISGWRQVLGLAVMDCTEVTNIKFCRLFEVTSFPTLVFLGTKATRTDRGEVIEAHRSIANLRHQALSLLQGNHSTGPHPRPPSWPSLDPLPDSEVSLAQLWNRVPQQVHTMVIVFESQASLVGQEVTLDLSGNPHCRVWHLVNPSPSSPLLWELSEAGSQPDNSTTQAIIYTVLRDSKAKFLLRQDIDKVMIDATAINLVLNNERPLEASATFPSAYVIFRVHRDLQACDELLRAPVPALATTLQRYLDSLVAVVSPAQLEATRRIVRDFAGSSAEQGPPRDDGEGAASAPAAGATKTAPLGPLLQEKLRLFASSRDNWVTELWLDDMYLNNDQPLPVNSSPFCLLPKQNFRTSAEQARFAARFIEFAVLFKRKIDNGTLRPDVSRSRGGGQQPLCMQTYRHFFPAYRRPGPNKDDLLLDTAMQQQDHVIVVCRDQFFRLKLPLDKEELDTEAIVEQLLSIKRRAKDPSERQPPVGILTTENRRTWSNLYVKLSRMIPR